MKVPVIGATWGIKVKAKKSEASAKAANVPIRRSLDYIVEGQQQGIFDIEEGALRHDFS
jgi:hypothetical protein